MSGTKMTPQNGTTKVSIDNQLNGSPLSNGTPNVFENQMLDNEHLEKGNYLSYSPDKLLLESPQDENHNNNRGHDHDNEKGGCTQGCLKTKESRLLIMLSMVFSIFFMEALVGQITNSLTLLADSFHMLSDALALVVALIAVTYSKRRAGEYLKPWFSRNKYSNTFGWVRFEVVGALVNATFLLALCLSIAMEAFEKFMSPQLPNDPMLVLIVGASGLVVNILGLLMFGGHVGHNHDHGHNDHKHSHASDTESVKSHGNHSNHGNHGHHHHGDQMNMRAVFLHVLGDALGSVVVVCNALIYIYVPHKEEEGVTQLNSTQNSTTSAPLVATTLENNGVNCDPSDEITINRWILYMDPALSLLLVIILCFTTIPLFKQSVFILLQSVPLHIDIHQLKKSLEKMDGVNFIHDFHIWQLAGEKMVATCHINVESYSAYEIVSKQLKQKLCDLGVHSLTMQPEFEDLGENCCMDCAAVECKAGIQVEQIDMNEKQRSSKRNPPQLNVTFDNNEGKIRNEIV